MTVEQNRRELFEAIWQKEMNTVEMDLHRFVGDGYASHETNRGWIIFNAALDAVVIELPRACAHEAIDGSGAFVKLTYELWPDAQDPVELCRLADCRSAIESTGLGIKVKS